MLIDSIADLVSEPLFLRLRAVLPHCVVHLKIEAMNVAGSIKLKTAKKILIDLEQRGALHRGCSVIESSSGNLGVALAFLCAERGYGFTCVSDPNISPATKRLIDALGGKVIIVTERDPDGGYLKSRIDLIRRMQAADPRLVWTNQYANVSNLDAHYLSTGPEILRSIASPDWVFIGAGTTGTLAGCSRYLREHSPKTRVIAVDSVGSVTFGGPGGPRHLPGMGTSLRPQLADECEMNRLVLVREEDAVRMCRELARRQGVLLGPSTGSVLSACASMAAEIGAEDTVVAISPDLGDRYLETLYDDEWIRSRFPRCTDDSLAESAQAYVAERQHALFAEQL